MSEAKRERRIHTTTAALENKIELAVKTYGMSFRGGVLLALSGGADSSALLFYLAKKATAVGFSLCAAHLNHMIRGAEADRDQKFCEELCEKLGVRLFLHKADIPALSEQTGRGLEEVAREERYTFFARILSENPAIANIATAHNATDNAETVIFNILRGSGARGLGGIPPVRGGNIIRPLILCTKDEILSYCDENSIEYVTDSTNADLKYTRNYIRGEIIPRFGKITPSPENAISRACASIRSDNDFIEEYARDFMEDRNIICEAKAEELSALHGAPLSRVLIKMHENALELYKYADNKGNRPPALEQKHIEAIAGILADKHKTEMRRICVPGSLSAVCERGKFFFLPSDSGKNDTCRFPVELSLGVNYITQEDALILRDNCPAEIIEEYKNIYKLSIHTVLSSDRIKGKLYARSRADGDKYRSGGMTRRLKKLFSDAKLPLSVRGSLPVVCDDSGIVWVPGFGVRDGCAAGDGDTPLHIWYAKK